jgi:hypothetical protein
VAVYWHCPSLSKTIADYQQTRPGNSILNARFEGSRNWPTRRMSARLRAGLADPFKEAFVLSAATRTTGFCADSRRFSEAARVLRNGHGKRAATRAERLRG